VPGKKKIMSAKQKISHPGKKKNAHSEKTKIHAREKRRISAQDGNIAQGKMPCLWKVTSRRERNVTPAE
jgi:hypothetical protein